MQICKKDWWSWIQKIVDVWEQVSRRTDNLNQKASHVHANSTLIWSSASCVLKALNISSQIIVPDKVMTYIQISLVYFTCDIEESTYLTAMEQQMELYIYPMQRSHTGIWWSPSYLVFRHMQQIILLEDVKYSIRLMCFCSKMHDTWRSAGGVCVVQGRDMI